MTQPPRVLGNGYAISRNLSPKLVCVDDLTALGRETRKHSPRQVRKLQASIEQFGFVLPIIIDGASRRARSLASSRSVIVTAGTSSSPDLLAASTRPQPAMTRH
jgi:hypothetical protein